jgi:hypothetical protein
MRCVRVAAVALLAALAFVPVSPAERAPEDRRQATHVVVGTVEGVYVRKDERSLHYIVEIAVEKVEKGTARRRGTRFTWAATCGTRTGDRPSR